MAETRTSPHQRAAEAFARQVREQFGDAVGSVLLYGSVARGETRGVNSDVDLLVVLSDDTNVQEFEGKLRDLAYDVELDHGVVLSLVVMSAAEYDARFDRPFIQHVRRDAEVLYG